MSITFTCIPFGLCALIFGIGFLCGSLYATYICSGKKK